MPGNGSPGPSNEVLRGGENVLSRVASGRFYGIEETDVKLPRKALSTLTHHYLYPKPTQVGKLRILRGAR